MATKFEEMRAAARDSLNRKAEYQQRCFSHMQRLYRGFLKYCEIPENQVSFWRWNGLVGEEAEFTRLQKNEPNNVLTAMVLGEDGFWRLGLRINLMAGAVFFPIWISERDGAAVTKIADETISIDLDNERQCAEFYDKVVDRVKETFSDGKKSKTRGYGFAVDPQPDSP